jgi:glycosyltransferase involved in cell wall biosynthesis
MDPAYVRRVRRVIETLQLAPQIRLHGTLTTPELAERFARSHLLCMPFAYEGFGITSLEALTFGVPVLGSTSGATGEIIQDGVNGCLFDSNAPQALAETVGNLFIDRDRLTRISLAALESARRHASWTFSMQRITSFLEQISRSGHSDGIR